MPVKYVSIITDYTYLLWQQEIQIYNFKKLGLFNDLCVVILRDPGEPLSDYARKMMTLCHTEIFENTQIKRHYIPSNQPFGLARILERYPKMGEKLFILDSDVIFRVPLDFSKMDNDNNWYASDTVSYVGYQYVSGCLGELDTKLMADIVGISTDVLKKKEQDSGGAQYYCKNITSQFCDKVTKDCIDIYDFITKFKKSDGSYKIQVWTALLWSWIWNMFLVADVKVIPELQFSWAVDSVDRYYKTKMLHIAGVTGKEPGCFYKGKYAHSIPWEVEKDFSFVDRSKCWGIYTDLIEEYRKLI